jgi:hypothetical protein
MHKISEVAAIPRNAAAAMAVVIRRARTAIAAAATRSVHAVAKAMHSVRAVMCSALRATATGAMPSAIACNVVMCSGIAQAAARNARVKMSITNAGCDIRSAEPGEVKGSKTGASTAAMFGKIGTNTAVTSEKTGVTIAATRATTGAIIAAMRVSIGHMIEARRGSGVSTTANMFTSRIGIAGAFAITIATIAVTSIA